MQVSKIYKAELHSQCLMQTNVMCRLCWIIINVLPKGRKKKSINDCDCAEATQTHRTGFTEAENFI